MALVEVVFRGEDGQTLVAEGGASLFDWGTEVATLESLAVALTGKGAADFRIATDGILGRMSLEKADSFINNVFLSLMIQRGFWFANPDFGSRLHLLSRGKNTEKSAALARDYCREALQWLLDIGRARSFEISTERDREIDLNRLKVLIRATQANGRNLTFETFIEVV